MSRAIGEQIYHPAGEHARLRNAIMGAKTSQDYYRDLAWLCDGTGLGVDEHSIVVLAKPSASPNP